MRWPTAVWWENGWVIAANVFPNGAAARLRERPLYLFHSRRGLLPLPSGNFLFAHPLVLTAPDTSLHLFWAEGAQSVEPPGWPWRFQELWHARFADGRWSRPDLIRRAQVVSWDPRPTQVVLDDRNQWHVVTNAADSGRPEAIEHLVQSDTGWERTTLEHGLYPTLAFVGGRRLLLAYVAGMPNGPANQLQYRESSDRGRTWNPPRRVLAEQDTAEVHHPELHTMNGVAYLGWMGERSRAGTVWQYTAALIDNSSITPTSAADAPNIRWQPPVRSAPIPGVLIAVTFVADTCGDVAALAEVISPEMRPNVWALRTRNSFFAVDEQRESAFAPLLARSGTRVLELWTGPVTPGGPLQPLYRERPGCGTLPRNM